MWQKFVKRFPKNTYLPTFPIWSMEFGATYPYIDETPYAVGVKRLGHYRGSHGVKLSQFAFEERFQHLPSHARTEENKFPDWKIQFIRQNRDLYRDNRDWIDAWLPEILVFPSSLQKLEWNCKGGRRDIWSYVIQFRASGVRVKKPSSSPSLVAMTSTQVPIIAWQRRYMTPRMRPPSKSRLAEASPANFDGGIQSPWKCSQYRRCRVDCRGADRRATVPSQFQSP